MENVSPKGCFVSKSRSLKYFPPVSPPHLGQARCERVRRIRSSEGAGLRAAHSTKIAHSPSKKNCPPQRLVEGPRSVANARCFPKRGSRRG